MENRCSQRVSGEGQWGAFQQHQCEKKAVVERDGKPYCKIHDPEYRKVKDEKRQAKHKANSCKSCGYYFPYSFYGYCPLCGTKR